MKLFHIKYRHLDRPNDLFLSLQIFCTAYWRFQRCADLSRLMAWAQRKHHTRVARYYRFLWIDTEERITRQELQFPIICKYAAFASAIYQFVFRPTGTRQSAAAYRLRKRSLIWR